MNKEVAITILREIDSSLGQLNALLVDVRDSLTPEEYGYLKRNIARIMNTADTGIVRGIVEAYPDLAHR